ncbi:MAG: sulfotransferase domain-containing protein, partial [Balneola sp.]
AISACYHNINYGFLPIEDPNELLRKIFSNKEIKGYPRANEIIEFGLYHKYLQMYHNFFESGKLLIIKHDDIKQDPINEIKKIYNYLEIDSEFIPKNLKSKPQAVVYNLRRLKFLRLRNRIIYKYNSKKTRLTKREGFLFKVIRAGFKQVDAHVLSKFFKNEKGQTSDTTIDLIRKTYSNDIESLENTYGLILENWKNKEDKVNVHK